VIALLCCMAAWAAAPGDGAPPESEAALVQPKPTDAGGFTFIGQFEAKSSATNLASTNPLLDGLVIGQMGAPTGVVPDRSTLGLSTEERVTGLFRYAPKALGGKIGLNAAFDVAFTWGDAAWSVGGNTGGGIGGRNVNLQTRRLYADFRPTFGHLDAHVLVGLQFVADSVNDPTAGGPDTVLRSGGRLMFFGTEAAGVTVYGRLHDAWGDRVKFRLGSYTLLEQGVSLPDDAWLSMADAEIAPAYLTTVGVHAWYLQDRTGGHAGLIGDGPTSALSTLQGGAHIDPYGGLAPPPDAQLYADLGWFGVDAAYDPSLTGGRFGLSGVAVFNLGRIYAPIAHDDEVAGTLLDAEVRARIAEGRGSIVKVEGLFSSGDSDRSPYTYTGVVTGNSYGIAGAIFASHGMLLLFPDPHAVNRLVSVVSDVGAGGKGVIAATATAGLDVVPNKLDATVGVGHAVDAAGQAWGTEVNARVVWTPMVACDVGAYAATVFVGPASGLTRNPWTAYLAVDLLVF
jgi:hypothetical protein